MAVKPMLAERATDLDALTYPFLCSDKLDGMRCLITPDGPQTRSGEHVPNHHVRSLLETLPVGLDGELCSLDDRGVPDFRRTMGDMRRFKGEPAFAYFVFDNYLEGDMRPFRVRWEELVDRFAPTLPPWATVLQQQWVNDAETVRRLFAEALDRGQEGLILRRPLGVYKHGRSTLKDGGMLKVKPYEDDEAEVVGFTAKRRNDNEATKDKLGHTKRSSAMAGRVELEQLGCLVVRNPKWPKDFEVGTGFTLHDRESMWIERDKLIGRTLRFQYVAVGGYDVPRHASFQGWREAFDMDPPAQKV